MNGHLSINESMPIAWANQAGILVQLHRYDDAITAADRVFAVQFSELPNTFAAAYYSKGDAFRALGKTAEARDLYAKAYALDNTLVPPDLSRDTAVPAASSAGPSSPGSPGFRSDSPVAAVRVCCCNSHRLCITSLCLLAEIAPVIRGSGPPVFFFLLCRNAVKN